MSCASDAEFYKNAEQERTKNLSEADLLKMDAERFAFQVEELFTYILRATGKTREQVISEIKNSHR